MSMNDVRDDGNTLGDTIGELAAAMLRLEPGKLAGLRRMKTDGPGEAVFWHLATRFGLRTDDKGLLLVKLMALLAPRGAVGGRPPFHSFKAHLGEVLLISGYSEARLARFLALPFDRRAEGLEAIVRFIAGKGVKGGVDCSEIASLLFYDDVKNTRRLARRYYNALNSAEAKDKAA